MLKVYQAKFAQQRMTLFTSKHWDKVGFKYKSAYDHDFYENVSIDFREGLCERQVVNIGKGHI